MAGQTETLINEILSWIDTGRLNPGDVIDEAELVTEFAVLRTPVRGAIL
jgi:DNA-binding GntR family transcriptional regulator